MRTRLGFVIFLLGTNLLFSGEDDFRLDEKKLYGPPSEFINEAEVDGVLRSKDESEEKITKLEAILEKYYSQFVSEKRIWEERTQGTRVQGARDINSVRLLIEDIQETLAESNLVRDSLFLYKIHTSLGNLYKDKPDTYKEALHRSFAFRYKNLSTTEDYFVASNRKIEGKKVSESQIHKEAREALLQKESELKKEKDKLHLAKAEIARTGKSTLDPKAIEETIKSKQKEVQDFELRYLSSYEENYLPFQKENNAEIARALYDLALVIKKLEEENKERLRVINKLGTAGRGVFVLFDYKRSTDFFAYESLLERAYRIDPNIPEINFEIAMELRRSGKKHKSIDYFNKFLELVDKLTSTNSNLVTANLFKMQKDAHLSLGILNADVKRKVQAGFHYEKYLQLEKEEDKRTKLFFELGRFFQKEIGNFEKAGSYFETWYRLQPSTKEPELEGQKTHALLGMSFKERFFQNKPKEKEYLNEGLKIIQELEAKERDAIDNYNKQLQILNVSKKSLLGSTNDDALSKYRIQEIRVDEAKDSWDLIHTIIDSTPRVEYYFRIAEILKSEKRTKEAREFYDLILSIGSEADLQKLKRLL